MFKELNDSQLIELYEKYKSIDKSYYYEDWGFVLQIKGSPKKESGICIFPYYDKINNDKENYLNNHKKMTLLMNELIDRKIIK